MKAWAVVAFAVSAAVGVGVGRGSDPPPVPPAPPPECPPVEVAPTCDPAALVACSARLAAVRAPRVAVGVPLSAAPDAEQPEVWEEELDAALDACGIAGPPDLVDCAAYPCVGALRAERVPEAAPDCDAPEDRALFVVPVQVRCGRRVERVEVALLWDPETLGSLAASADDPELDEVLQYGLLGQRVQHVVESWPCAE